MATRVFRCFALAALAVSGVVLAWRRSCTGGLWRDISWWQRLFSLIAIVFWAASADTVIPLLADVLRRNYLGYLKGFGWRIWSVLRNGFRACVAFHRAQQHTEVR